MTTELTVGVSRPLKQPLDLCDNKISSLMAFLGVVALRHSIAVQLSLPSAPNGE